MKEFRRCLPLLLSFVDKVPDLFACIRGWLSRVFAALDWVVPLHAAGPRKVSEGSEMALPDISGFSQGGKYFAQYVGFVLWHERIVLGGSTPPSLIIGTPGGVV